MVDDNSTRRADADDYMTRAGLGAGARVFGRYRLEALVGRGGMGVVWKARDERLERLVALKFLPEVVAGDPEAVRDLLRETTHCLELTHPNIVRVYDLVQEGPLAAIAMEYVDGESLAKRKAASPGGCLTLGELRPLTAQLCAALDYAHGVAKIVHRDLKPGNLLLTRDGQLKVTDFGIARSLSDTHTRLTGRVSNTSGTLAYMSPQQLQGEDPAASDDIYALGATLYELLTGKPPFHTGDLAMQVRERTPSSLAGRRKQFGITGEAIPAAWEETIAACLAKGPGQRPQSAGEVAWRLGVGPAPPPSPRLLKTGAAGPRRPTAIKWALGAAATLAIAITAWWLLYESARVVIPSGEAVAPNRRNVEPTANQKSAAVPSTAVALSRVFTVTVDPADAGARLWLGPVSDIAVKEGKAVLKDLPDGEQELTIQAPGYQPYTTRVTVKNGQGRVAVKLVPVRGAIAVTARPGTQVTAVDERGQETRLGAVPASRVLEVENLLPIGRYTLRLEHTDCAAVTVSDVDLVLGRTIKVAPSQTPLPGELSVSSVPPGAEVRIDGAVAGITPAAIKNQPSEQALRLEVFLRGYRRVEQAVTLKPKEVRTLDLGVLTVEKGSLELRLTNAGVRMADLAIRIDGRSVDVGPALAAAPFRLDGLEAGSCTVEIVHPDYEPWQQTVTVRAKEVAAVNVELKPKPGTVACETTPAGARVIVDGGDWHGTTLIDDHMQAESLTPLQGALPPGTYTLHFELMGYKVAAQTVTVAANRTVKVSAVLEKQVLPESGHTWENTLGMMFAPVPGTGVLFCIWETRVQDFEAFVQADNSYWLYHHWSKPDFPQGPTHPAVNVSWDDAKAFCRWLTEKERGEGRLGPNQEYRLPTDAEWSVAVGLDEPADGTPRSKDRQIKGVYPWGMQWPPPHGTGNFADKASKRGLSIVSGYDDGYDATAPVGSFQPNRYGLYDLSGNVWEWCEDYYNGSSGSRVLRGDSRVLRGGSFINSEADSLLSSIRGVLIGQANDCSGFRCVMVVSAP